MRSSTFRGIGAVMKAQAQKEAEKGTETEEREGEHFVLTRDISHPDTLFMLYPVDKGSKHISFGMF